LIEIQIILEQANKYIYYRQKVILIIGCYDMLPSDYESKCTWTCSQWAGIDGNGNNYCNHSWSTKRMCAPYSKGKIKDYCKLSCSNCGK
jgi:hypothetical protein